jgi:hypothetical protein
MSETLEQMNISYSPTEDRLLLRVRSSGEAEFRVWLTRRYANLLLNVLNDQINSEGGIQELASSQETLSRLRSGAFEQAYSPQPKQHYPLGENGVVAFRINTGKTEAGAVNLQLLPEEGQGLNIVLNKSMLYMLYNLLEQGLGQTDWNMALPQGSHEPVH